MKAAGQFFNYYEGETLAWSEVVEIIQDAGCNMSDRMRLALELLSSCDNDQKQQKQLINSICECLNTIIKAASHRDLSLFSTSINGTYSNKNDYNRVTYGTAIANACNLGRLKRYYLICTEEKTEHLTKNGKIICKPKDKKNMNSDLDIILKITAAYLLECKRSFYKENTWIYLIMSDICNWGKNNPKTTNLYIPRIHL